MKQTISILRLLGMAAPLCLAAVPQAHAAAIVTSNVTFNTTSNLYTYSYSVQNTGLLDDLVLVSIPTISILGVTDIFAPVGFSLAYDASQMWVNLIEDGSIVTDQTFAPGSTIAGFSYSSASAPGAVTYLAYDASGTEYSASTQSAVPEPSSALLCGLAAIPMLRRRRRA